MVDERRADFRCLRRGASFRLSRMLGPFLAMLGLLAVVFAAAPAQGQQPESIPFGIYHAKFIENEVLASGQPTADQIVNLSHAGYRTDIDLRRPAEARGFNEPRAAAAAGLDYVNIPVSLKLLDRATIDRFIRSFATAKRPVLVHCASSNRVGALYYAYLVEHEGVAPAEAMQRALKAGLHEPALIKKVRGLVDEAESQQP